MSTATVTRLRAQLNTRLLDDAVRQSTLVGIQQMAQQSALAQDPSIAVSLGALASKGAALSTEIATIAGLLGQLRAAIASRNTLRGVFDSELVTLKTLVENQAAGAGDITGLGFTVLAGNDMTQAPPDPPAALLVRTGNAHGKARVSVQGKGYQGHFAAEMSLAAVTPASWSALPGTGKERRLTGYASGTQIWVRFAAVRFGMQSDWSVPVLVTIP
jgi:hypothetical protein